MVSVSNGLGRHVNSMSSNKLAATELVSKLSIYNLIDTQKIPDFLRFQHSVHRNLGASKIICISTRGTLDSKERTHHSLWHHIITYWILGPSFHFCYRYWMSSFTTMGFDGQMLQYGMCLFNNPTYPY